jgi:dTDP-4-dehydrorhamnose reductase
MGLTSRIGQLLIADEEKYSNQPRDIRINTEKITKLGVDLGNTAQGIRQCLQEYSLNF